MARRHWNGRGEGFRWKAEVKVDYVLYYLGLHPTQDLAEQAEADFRLAFAGRTRKEQRRVAR